MKVVHLIMRRRFVPGDDVSIRCGKTASVDTVGVGAAKMIDAAGNEFYGSTHSGAVTCKKCINLITVGTIHVKRRKSRAKRAVATSRLTLPKSGASR